MAPPYSVRHAEETDSTQDDARSAYEDRPVLVVAARQRKGRGRSASEWVNAPRAMAASLALRPAWRTEDLPRLPLLAGLAAARVFGCDLKWPNDLMVGDDKVGGILVEVSGGLAVVGLGLNLWWPDAPEGWSGLHQEDPGPARRRSAGPAWAEEMLALVHAGPAWPVDEYRRRCTTLGRDITWEPGGSGTAIDVDADGGLVVETADGRTVLRAGAVRHVRPA